MVDPLAMQRYTELTMEPPSFADMAAFATLLPLTGNSCAEFQSF